MLSIVKRILGQMKNDKRSLGLFICTAAGFNAAILFFSDSSYVPKLAVYDMNEKFVAELENHATVSEETKPGGRRLSGG